MAGSHHLNESFKKLRKQNGILKQSIGNEVHSENDTGNLPLDVTDWAPSPEALCGASELREILIHCLQRLTPTLNIVFVLRDIDLPPQVQDPGVFERYGP